MPLGRAYHVLPVNDLVEHNARPDCICGPDVSHEEDLLDSSIIDFVFQHHALDGREEIEL